jgi:hypothetical protein
VPRSSHTLRYVLLPRPWDVPVKGLFVVVPLLLGWGAAGTSPSLASAGACLLGLEVLGGQARYVINDVLGRHEDRRHPCRDQRARLPDLLSPSAAVSWAAGRVGLAIGVALLLPAPLGRGLAIALAAVALLTVGYEFLRRRLRGKYPLDPAVSGSTVGALWIWVGLGYGVRSCFGAWLGGNGATPPAVLATVTVTGWALGTMHVTMAWALEATAVLAADRTAAEPGGFLTTKCHLLLLLRHLPHGGRTPVRRPLSGSAQVHAPWNLALVLAAASAAVQGVLAVRTAPGRATWALLVPAVAAATAGAVIALGAAPTAAVVAAVGAVALCVTASAVAGGTGAISAGVPLAAVFTVYLLLRRMPRDALLR